MKKNAHNLFNVQGTLREVGKGHAAFGHYSSSFAKFLTKRSDKELVRTIGQLKKLHNSSAATPFSDVLTLNLAVWKLYSSEGNPLELTPPEVYAIVGLLAINQAISDRAVSAAECSAEQLLSRDVQLAEQVTWIYLVFGLARSIDEGLAKAGPQIAIAIKATTARALAVGGQLALTEKARKAVSARNKPLEVRKQKAIERFDIGRRKNSRLKLGEWNSVRDAAKSIYEEMLRPSPSDPKWRDHDERWLTAYEWFRAWNKANPLQKV